MVKLTSNTPASDVAAPELPRVFISYSRKDATLARLLHGALQERELQVWIDWEGIPPSAEWWNEVQRAIEASAAFLFIISPDSVASRVCGEEVAHALRHNKRLIPVVCRDAALGDAPASEIAAALARINWIFLRDPAEFGPGLHKLTQAIRTDLDWVREHSRLLQRAVEWEAHRRDPSYLLQDNDLVAGEAWIAKGALKDPRPTSLQTEYVLAGRAATVKRRRRLMGAAAVAGTLVLVASLVAGWQKLLSDERQAEATSRRLAAQVPLAFSNDAWDLGLLLAVHAYDRSPTVEAAQGLLGALERLRGVRAVLPNRNAAAADSGEAGPGLQALSDDGKWLLTASCPSQDRTECEASGLHVVETTRSQIVARLPAAFAAAVDAAFDPSGRRLAVSLEAPEPGVVVIDLPADLDSTGAPVELGANAVRLPTVGGVTQLAFAGPDRLGGVIEQEIFEWSLAEGKVTRKRPADLVGLRSPAGRRLAMSNDEGRQLAQRLLLGDDPARAIADIPPDSLRMPPAQVVFNADRTLAAVLGCALMASGRHCEGELRLVDVAPRRARGRMFGGGNGWTDAMLAGTFLRDAKVLVTGGCGELSRTEACLHGALRLWRIDEEGLEAAGAPLRSFGGTIRRLLLAGDGRTLVSTSSLGHHVVWTVDPDFIATSGVLPSILQSRVQPPSKSQSSAPSSPQPGAIRPSARAATLACNGEALENPDLLAFAALLRDPATVCKALPAGAGPFRFDEARRLLAVADCTAANAKRSGCERGGAATLWTASDGSLRKVREHVVGAWISAMAFAPGRAAHGNEQLALAHCDKESFRECTSATIHLFGGDQAAPRLLANGLPRVSALALDATGKRLAFGTCGAFPESGPPTDGCGAGAIQLLDIADEGGRPVDGTLTGHNDVVSFIAFDPRGQVLASGDAEGRIALWDLATRQPLGPPMPLHYAAVNSMQFTAPGVLRVSAADAAFEWHTDAQRWKDIACRLAGRRLTPAERHRWIGAEAARPDPCAAVDEPRPRWLAWLMRLTGRG